LLFPLVFASGLAGLIYQVLWLRQLSLVFGVTVYAASTVLAAFMGGLAIGSILARGLFWRRVSPLAAFGVAEILVGASGLASPLLLDAASSIYQALHRAAPDSIGVLTLARLVCSFVILALPTAMMGLTLPLLSAVVSTPRGANGPRIGLVYAVNTLGAMTGTLLCGLLLIPAIGIRRSFFVAACVNVTVGAVAAWAGRGGDRASANPPSGGAGGKSSEAEPGGDRRLLNAVRAVALVSGFASLGLEIVWFRLMLQFVAATAEAFTAMLATVLGGIAIGAMIAARLLRPPGDHPATLGVAQALTGAVSLGSLFFLLWTVEHGWKTMGLWPAVLIAILPPSVCMGVGLPLALGIVAPGGRTPAGDVAGRVGAVYALNVAGAIAGSLASGFVLLPRIGSLNTLIVLSAMFVASGMWLLWRRQAAHRIAGPAIVAAFLAFAALVPDPFHVAIDRRYGNTLQEVWRDEGAQTAVSVRAGTGQRVLYLDGLHQASDAPEMVSLHRSIGHLPMLLHRAPADVLVIGIGGGATPGALSLYPGAKVEVVELSDGVRRAAPHFAHVNYDLLRRPNVNVRIDDGRNFLALTDRRFDVITADVIQPEHAGAGLVYSREYFGLVRDALKEDGVALQWIGHRPPVEYTLIMRTFLDAFPDATLWYDGNFMIGTRRPLSVDPDAVDRLRAHPTLRAALDAVGLTGFDVLRSWYTADAAAMRAFVGSGAILTDDRPLVEYRHWLPRPEDQEPLDLSRLTRERAPLAVDPPG
jgi:spermidine synthase